jgi:hypothetical protein
VQQVEDLDPSGVFLGEAVLEGAFAIDDQRELLLELGVASGDLAGQLVQDLVLALFEAGPDTLVLRTSAWCWRLAQEARALVEEALDDLLRRADARLLDY